MFYLEIWNNNLGRTGNPDFYMSTQYDDLDDKPWEQGLIDINGINYAIDRPHGGMVKAKFGTIQLLPTVTCTDYIGVNIYYQSELLYAGVAFIKERTRTALTFELFSDAPVVQIDSELDYTGGTHSLISIFQDFCDTQVPAWTLSSTGAVAGLYVDYIAETGQLFADMLSDLCQTYGHYFVVDSTSETIYLRAVTYGAGVAEVVSGVEYYPSRYNYLIPPAKVTLGDETAYGDPYYFGSSLELKDFGSSDNLSHAENIRDIYTDNPEQFSLSMPVEYFAEKGINFITKNKVSWTEDSVVFSGGSINVTYTMVVLNVAFNIQQNRAVLSGRII